MTEESRRIQQAERARVEADARHHQQIADDRRRAQEVLQRRIEAQTRERAQVVARKIEQDRESRRRENQSAKAADTRKMFRENRERNSESKSLDRSHSLGEPRADRLLPGDAIVDEFARQVTAREQAEGPRLELTAEFAKPDYIREAQTRTSATDRLAAAERIRRGDRADSVRERAPTERLEEAQRVRSAPAPRGNQEYHERNR